MIKDILAETMQLMESSKDERANLKNSSLSQLVQSFTLGWREERPEDLESLVSFISVIAVLMEWKAILLLPAPSKILEENEFIEQRIIHPAEDLADFKKIALFLRDKRKEQELMLRREPLPFKALQVDPPDPLLKLKLIDLQTAFQRIAGRLLNEAITVQIKGEAVSRKDCQAFVESFLQVHRPASLEQLMMACPPYKAYWIVAFLVLLEMIQQRVIALWIEDHGDQEPEVFLSWLDQPNEQT